MYENMPKLRLSKHVFRLRNAALVSFQRNTLTVLWENCEFIFVPQQGAQLIKGTTQRDPCQLGAKIARDEMHWPWESFVLRRVNMNAVQSRQAGYCMYMLRVES